MPDYFGFQARSAAELRELRLEIHPEDPIGSSTNPLGLGFDAPGDRYLMGLRCGCGRTCLVAAHYFESSEPLDCPTCGQSLR